MGHDVGNIVPELSAVGVGIGSLASYLEKAPSPFRTCVPPGLDEFGRIIMRPPLAHVMDPLPVRPPRPSHRIQGGHRAEENVVEECSGKDQSIWRTAGYVRGMDPENLSHAGRAGGVRSGGGDVAERGAAPYAYDGCRPGGDFPGDFDCAPSPGPDPHELTVEAALKRPLDDADVFAGEIPHAFSRFSSA